MENSPNKLIPVSWSTMIIVAISIIPFVNFINIFCCAGIILGGVIGTIVYSNQMKNINSQIYIKDAVIIGILSGILSAIVVTGVNLLLVLYSKQNPVIEVIEMLKTVGKDFPQEIYEQMYSFSEEFDKYGYSPTLTIFSLFVNLVLHPLFASIGGIMVVLIKKSKK